MSRVIRYMAFAVFLIGTVASLAQTTATLTGTVTSDGDPLPGALVTVSVRRVTVAISSVHPRQQTFIQAYHALGRA